MKQASILNEYRVGETLVRYLREEASGRVGLVMLPSDKAGDVAVKRTVLGGLRYIDSLPNAGDTPATVLDSLVHLKLVGDSYPGGFSQGRTMRGSASNNRFRFVDQSVAESSGRTTVTTRLSSDENLTIEHRLWWHDGDEAVYVDTQFRNGSQETVTLEMLSSFSLGGITPFSAADASGRLHVHRYRAGWSAEGRRETRSIEQLHLERSWLGAAAFNERFGQVGSLPVRGFFPFVAVTDVEADVTWGAQLAWAGSWQLEVFRQHDDVCLSGGLADREFGHWMKRIEPRQTFTAPTATLACVSGGIDALCPRLVEMQQRAVDQQPTVEQDLPIIFNEWCTTWGDPTHEKLVALADRLRDSEVKYLVIDAGWYKSDGKDWGTCMGDWEPNAKLFPNGLKATADAIRQRGLIPGLWFEMESVGIGSKSWDRTDALICRDGLPITSGGRRFWDLSKDWVCDELAQKVIGQLRDGGFGYLKVDYNESAGFGVDHPDSQGEGLRRHIEAARGFFERIRRELPDLVIENCSSGGHRLEPSLMGLTAMGSFSDAHELDEIPLIAANLHDLILPRQNQIWSVIRPSDSDQRIVYLLTSTFLGRMCLSGDAIGLSDSQWTILQDAMALYRQVTPILKHGKSQRVGQWSESWRYPEGWQAVIRTSHTADEALVVAYAFDKAPSEIEIALPESHQARHVKATFPANVQLQIDKGALRWVPPGNMASLAVHLTMT